MDINEIVDHLYQQSVHICNCLRQISTREKNETRSVAETLQTTRVAVHTIQKFTHRLFLDGTNLMEWNTDPKAENQKDQSNESALKRGDLQSKSYPITLCQLAVQENGWEKGLLHRRLPRLLLRDELRRLFVSLHISIPLKLQDQLEVEMLDLFGDNERTILYEDVVLSLFPFLVFKESSVENYSISFYQLISTLYEHNDLTLNEIEHAVQVVVKMWLWVVRKPQLLGSSQVSYLVQELFEVSNQQSEQIISKPLFLGSCLMQTRSPGTLQMQRLMATLFAAAPNLVRQLWDGEMPFPQDTNIG